MTMLDSVGRLLTMRLRHRPVFVIGLSRSGTTALFGGITKHPHAIGARHEHPFVGRIGKLVQQYSTNQYLRDSLHVSEAYFHEELRRMIFEIAVGRYFGLRTTTRYLIRGKRNLLGKGFWCAKTFLGRTAYLGIKTLYPQAKYIHIQRNGCEAVESRSHFRGFASHSFQDNCEAWANSVRRYMYIKEADDAISINHESLLQQPESVFERVFDFIGAPNHPEPSRFVRSTLLHPRNEQTKREVDVAATLAEREPAHARWTAQQRRIFIDICGEAMREAGYAIPFEEPRSARGTG